MIFNRLVYSWLKNLLFLGAVAAGWIEQLLLVPRPDEVGELVDQASYLPIVKQPTAHSTNEHHGTGRIFWQRLIQNAGKNENGEPIVRDENATRKQSCTTLEEIARKFVRSNDTKIERFYVR